MSAGHTPGPWVVDGADTIRPGVVRGYYVASASSGRIGQTFLNCLVTTDDECLANAELFAAAPNLLAERDRLKALNAELAAALEEITDVADRCDSWQSFPSTPIAAARAALAKARSA